VRAANGLGAFLPAPVCARGIDQRCEVRLEEGVINSARCEYAREVLQSDIAHARAIERIARSEKLAALADHLRLVSILQVSVCHPHGNRLGLPGEATNDIAHHGWHLDSCTLQ